MLWLDPRPEKVHRHILGSFHLRIDYRAPAVTCVSALAALPGDTGRLRLKRSCRKQGSG